MNVHYIVDLVVLGLATGERLVNHFKAHVLEEVLIGSTAYTNTDAGVFLVYFKFVLAEQVHAVGSERQEVSSVLLVVEAGLTHQVVLSRHELNFA